MKLSIEDRNLVDGIMSDSNIKYCYSKKRGLYERPDGYGYTQHLYFAGIFPKEDVCRWCEQSHGEITPVPVNLKERNELIREKIKELNDNLLPEEKGGQDEQHEWLRLRRFFWQCVKCKCYSQPSGDRESEVYSLDGKIWIDEEPECIKRPDKEAGKDDAAT